MTINALTDPCPKPILKPGGLQVATVIITGISRGIGLGLAARYLERGDTVAGTVRAANAAVADGDRFVALFEELTLELGFSPIPWLEIVAYGGYQLIASITPRFFDTIVYTPVAGVRAVFG